MATERSFSLAAVVALLALTDARAPVRAQQPAPAAQVTSPESLSIHEQPPPAPTSSLLQNYPPGTAARLKRPADVEWLMVRRTYDGWGYSPLDQITTKNVSRLQPGWSLSTGLNNGPEARRL